MLLPYAMGTTLTSSWLLYIYVKNVNTSNHVMGSQPEITSNDVVHDFELEKYLKFTILIPTSQHLSGTEVSSNYPS